MNRTIMYHWLNSSPDLSPEEKTRLLKDADIEEIYTADEEALKLLLKRTGIVHENAESALMDTGFKEKCLRNYEDAVNKGILITCPDDKDYPSGLRNIFTPPLCIYCIGHLPKKGAIAVVGSRNCSEYGKRTAVYFGKGLAKVGTEVISGMARGIDGIVQRAVLDEGGVTYAVLGSGVDVIYPKQNEDLYNRITEKGGVISEQPPGTPPVAVNFPRRNRLISAFSSGILLIEAGFRSGSLITVNYGLEQGKEIMAVPGRIDDRLSEGCLDMIKSGAVPVTCVDDVILNMGRG